MCLEIKKGQRAKIAKEDIKCYKVILLKMDNWYTFYQKMHIYPGSKYRSDIVIDKYNFYNQIDIALHSFTTKIEAVKFTVERIPVYSLLSYKVITCIIPKGSKYYIGRFNNSNDSYASDTLIYPDKF